MATRSGPQPSCAPYSRVPARPNAFVAASEDLYVIKKALRNGHGALVVGPDRSNNSAFAAAAVHDLVEQHQLPGRVFWLKVGQRPLDTIVHELGAQVCQDGVTLAQDADPQLRQLGQVLTQRRDLLVLENLRPESDDPQGMEPLLCGLQGVQLLALGPSRPELTCAPPWTEVTLTRPSAAQCAERLAELSRPTTAPAGVWHRLCQRLDGSLVSLQLAARLVASGRHPPAQLLSQLEGAPHAAAATPRPSAGAAEPSALSTLFTWSQRTLSPSQRTLLFATGLLPPDSPLLESFVAHAVGYTQPADLHGDLRTLAALGLLRWDSDLKRYEQAPDIRAEAARRLVQGRQGDALLWRALSGVLAGRTGLPEGPDVQAMVLRFLADRYQEHPGGQPRGGALVAWARRMGEHPGYPLGLVDCDRALAVAYGAAIQMDDRWAALALARASGRLFQHQFRTGEALEWYVRGLSHARRLANHGVEGELLERLGDAYQRHGQLDRAIDHLAQAYHAAQRANNRADQARRLSMLASAYLIQGESRMAVANFEQSLLLLQDLGDRRQQASDLGQLGVAYRDLGHVYTAIDYHERALRLAKSLGDPELESTQLEHLGTSHRALGALAESNRHRQRALQLARTLGDREAEARLLTLLGETYLEQGDVWQAIACYEEALSIARRRHDRLAQSALLGSLALATQQAGDWRRASDYYEQALSEAQALGDPHGEGQYLFALGQLRLRQGEAERAAKDLQRSAQLAHEAGDLDAACQRYIALGDAQAARGDATSARLHWQTAHRLLQALPDPSSHHRALSLRLRPATATTTAAGVLTQETTAQTRSEPR